MRKSFFKLVCLTALFSLMAVSTYAKTEVTTYKILIKSADAGGGSVNYICHAGDTLSFSFSPISNWRVYSIMLNGTDVTGSLVGGILKIENVLADCTLNATFALSTNNNPPTPGNEGVKVFITPTDIVVDGTQKDEIVSLYSLSGKKLKQLKSDGNKINFPVEQNVVYILKTKTQTFKVML